MRHVMALRVSKAVLVSGIALFYTILVLNNITDYGSNYEFVRHVLMMDSTFPGNHHRIAEYRLAREDWDNLRCHGECREHQNVNFRMPEDPEEVHPEHCRASGLRVEEVAAEVAVHHQHELRGCQRTDRKDHHPRHDEIEPRQQRHFPQSHPWAAHAEDRGQNVDCRSDAAETRNKQGKRPEVRAVPNRKCSRSQWRVGEPSHVGSISRPIEAVCSYEAEIKKQATK